MKILILTDHSRHSISNSFYGIVNALIGSYRTSSVYVASRATRSNYNFFIGIEGSRLFAKEVIDPLEYPENAFFNDSKAIDINDIDFILLRLPYPIHNNFFNHLCSIFPEDNIVNSPSGIQETGNKKYLLHLDKYVVPTQLCKTADDILQFSALHDCVLKPLESYGGKGLFKIEDGKSYDVNGEVSFDSFLEEYQKSPVEYIAMRYLKNVVNGDKRIVVVGGKVLASTLRTPQNNKWVCNVSQGGKDRVCGITDREKEIVDYLSPKLSDKGIFYYGLDTLEDDNNERVISEINTMSPGGMTPAEIKSSIKVSSSFARLLIDYCEEL